MEKERMMAIIFVFFGMDFIVLYYTQLDSKAEWTKEKEFLQILDSFSSPTFTSLPRFAGTRIIYCVISNHSLSFISKQYSSR